MNRMNRSLYFEGGTTPLTPPLSLWSSRLPIGAGRHGTGPI